MPCKVKPKVDAAANARSIGAYCSRFFTGAKCDESHTSFLSGQTARTRHNLYVRGCRLQISTLGCLRAFHLDAMFSEKASSGSTDGEHGAVWSDRQRTEDTRVKAARLAMQRHGPCSG